MTETTGTIAPKIEDCARLCAHVRNMDAQLTELQGLSRAICLLVENTADRDAPAYVTIAGEVEDRVNKLREHWQEMWELALAIEHGDG